MLPTGLPTRQRHKRLTYEQRLANLFNIYGVPYSYKWVLTYIDYYQTKSLFSLINLIKIEANYGLGYCCSALAVTLGRSAAAELKDLETLHPKVSLAGLSRNYEEEKGALPLLTELTAYFNLDSFNKLSDICRWFDYEPFTYPGEYLRVPLSLISWLPEPYRDRFTDLSPRSIIFRKLQRHVPFSTSVELNSLVGVIFND